MTFPTTHPALARALAARGYDTATAVQSAVLASEAAGRDLLVSAQTGSGKTVAFGLALAPSLLGEAERFEPAGAPAALVIAPTRELALQVQRELAWLYADTGARVVTCVGGMDPRAEARELRQGAHLVVGTPGRLRDHLERRQIDLSALKAVVLDEADEMLDLGFREDLEFILDATPDTRRALLFSATLPPEIETLARRYQRDALRIATAHRHEQHADIEYQAMRVAPFDIENAVVNVLRFHEARAAIVFCTTREAVKRMHARLVERGFAAVALSGELTQNERTQAIQALRDGRARVLVATDVAARGLDLPDLALVIHANLPHDPETLLHRSGRTGRAGKKGLCIVIAPYNRRRQVMALLDAARLSVTWTPPPMPEEIRARDQERFLAEPMFTDTAGEEETAAVEALKARHDAEAIALALVRMQAARLPAPEELTQDSGPPPRSDRPGAGDRFERRDRFGRSDRPGRFERGDGEGRPREFGARKPRRDDNRPMVWFRLNIGRDKNADPRWLLPLICNAGGVTKAEIGSIRIQDRDTRFQILAERADEFTHNARTNKTKEGQITRVGENDTAPAHAEAERHTAASAPPAEPVGNPREPEGRRDVEHRPPRDKARSERHGKPGFDPDRKPRAETAEARGPRGDRAFRDKPRYGDHRGRDGDRPRGGRPFGEKPRFGGNRDRGGDERGSGERRPFQGKPRAEAEAADRPRQQAPASPAPGAEPAPHTTAPAKPAHTHRKGHWAANARSQKARDEKSGTPGGRSGWQDRKGEAGEKRPHGGPRQHPGSKFSSGDRPRQAPGKPWAGKGGGKSERPVSKYQHKKKQRQPASP